MAWLYCFESKEIQKFIMRSDKLRDMVGGSELVNQLCGEFLIESIAGLGISESRRSIIAQAAGWARIVFDEKADVEKIYNAWPFLVNHFAPGLQIVQSMAEITSGLPAAINQCSNELREKRNCFSAVLPEIGPLVERAPQTGLPAIRIDKKGQYVDRQSERKQRFADAVTLIKKMTGNDAHQREWPVDIDRISSRNNSYVAIIHADGNDLGKCLVEIGSYLQKQPNEAGNIYAGFSKAIEQATVLAAQSAYYQVLEKDYEQNNRKCVAARPIVLGGDDLTLIIRADLAVSFTKVFLSEFAEQSTLALNQHLGRFSIPRLPSGLTACAGIAFVKKSFPFHAGYELAESLCAYSKKAAKKCKTAQGKTPTSFSFHRVTTSMTDNFEEVVVNELSSTANHKLTFSPYYIGRDNVSLAKLDDLLELTKVLATLPSGTMRTLISTIYSDISKADNEFNRILQIAGAPKKKLLIEILKRMTDNAEAPLWDKAMRTPINDAYVLKELMGIKDAKEGTVDAES